MSLVSLGFRPCYLSFSTQLLSMLYPLPYVEKMRVFIDTKVSAVASKTFNIILFISCQVPAGFKETGQWKGVCYMNCSTLKKKKK